MRNCNGRSRAQVMQMLLDWTRSAYRETRTKTRIENVFPKSYYCLLYKRTSKERRKRKSSNVKPPLFYIQFVCYLRMILHVSMYQPNNRLMILHTWKLFLSVQPRHIVRCRNTSSYLLISATTPHRPTSQHFFLRSYHLTLIPHPLLGSSRLSRTFVPAFP
jgi:hypothetical protein